MVPGPFQPPVQVASFIGIFVTVMAAATLVTATGSLLEGGIRGAVPPERLAGADIVVAADQDISVTRGRGDDQETVGGFVVERVRIPTDLAAQVESVAGVAASSPTSPSLPTSSWTANRSPGQGDAVSLGTPGAAPAPRRSASSRVTRRAAPTTSSSTPRCRAGRARRRGPRHCRVSGSAVEVTVTGVGDPSGNRSLTEQSAVFFSDAAARTLYAHSDQADLLVVTVDKGADAATVATALGRVLAIDRSSS